MAASVRIEDKAFSDQRIEYLAELTGRTKYDALGRMAYLWRECTDRESYVLPESFVSMFFDVEKLIISGLSEKTIDGIRIKGTEGRIEWIGNLRKGNAAGGISRASNARRDAKGRLLPSSSPGPRLDSDQRCPGPSSAPTPTPTPTLKSKPMSEPKTVSDVSMIFDHYKTYHLAARVIGGDTVRKIKARLKEGFTIEDIKKAIDGNHISPHHNGQNDTGTEYHDLELIVRSAAKVRQFMGYVDNPPKPKQVETRYLSPLEERNQRQAEYSERRLKEAVAMGFSSTVQLDEYEENQRNENGT